MPDTELGRVLGVVLHRGPRGTYILTTPSMEIILLSDEEWRSLVSLARLWFAEEEA